jgi:hypothetical protein
MAAYPNTEYSTASRVTPRSALAMDVASDGTVRGRVVSTGEVYDLTLVHDFLLEADAQTIETFYGSNRTAQVEVTWRGDTYNAYFASKPTVEPAGGLYWKVTSTLIGRLSDGS